MIEQLPILNMLAFLFMALIIPLFRKRSFNVTTNLGLAVLFMVFISSIVLVFEVINHGGFYYQFGNYNRFIGIEFLIDPFSALFALFIVSLVIIIYIYSTGDATEGIAEKSYGRYYILLFILLFAMLGIIYTNDLFNIYVFMEILSITTVSIISIKRKKENYRAAFRYVMLNEVGSLSYLFGVALLYMVTGYTNIELVAESIQGNFALYPANILTAIVFMIIGVGIKAAIFPFHVWLPDAHATAPSSSSAILSAIVVKVYILILIKVLFRVFGIEILDSVYIPTILMIVASTGMIMGSVFAIAQKDIKRMLGYSSVAQIGYILLGISMASVLGLQAAFFHIMSHGFMKAALFLSVGAIIYKLKIRQVKDFDGVAYQMPVAMFVFSLAALGMIGIPLTTGFISKLNLGLAALDSGYIILIAVLIVSGLLNALYYLPIIIQAFLKDNKADVHMMHIEKIPKTMLFPIAFLGVLIFGIGVFPGFFLDLFMKAAEAIMVVVV